MQSDRRTSALVVPTLMLAFASIYAWANRDVPGSEMRFAAPVAVGLGLLALMLFARALRGAGTLAPALTIARVRRPTFLLVSTLAFLALAGWDFPLAAAIQLAVAIPLLGYRRWWVVAAVALMLPVALHLGFRALGVPLASVWLGA